MFCCKLLDELPLHPLVKAGARTVVQAAFMALQIQEQYRKKNWKFVFAKEDNSTQTAADPVVQAFILNELLEQTPELRFLVEEDMPDLPHLQEFCLSERDFRKVYDTEFSAVIDPIDWTSNFCVNGYEWGCMGALLRYGRPWASFIFAPQVLEGLLCVSEIGAGSWCLEKEGEALCKSSLLAPDILPKPQIGFGIHLTKDKAYQKFLYELTAGASPAPTVACGLGGMKVCAGMAHLYMHGELAAYDTLPGIIAVKACGGYVKLFRKNESGFTLFDEPDGEYFNPKRKTGGILGSKAHVERCARMLLG